VWTAYRIPTSASHKHYIHLDTLDSVRCFAWATLEPRAGFVNGICFEIDNDDLRNIDNREVGYTRTDVTHEVTPYGSFNIKPGEPVYAYISETHDPETLYPDTIPYISADYVNMAFLGALFVNTFTEGFYADFVSTTDALEAAVRDIRQLFWSNDGTRLYLLDEKDSTVILVHDFGHNVFPAHSKTDIHSHRNATKSLSAMDLRSVTLDKSSLYYKCMCCRADEIESFLSSKDPWVAVYLVKNANMTTDQIGHIRTNGNFVARLILEYQDDQGDPKESH